MWPRLSLLAVAIAALAFGAVHLHAARSCRAAQEHARQGAAGAAGELLSRCPGALPLATGSVALLRARRPADAGRLALAAVRRQPADYVGWLALGDVRATAGDGAGARRARERARRLNPLAAGLRPSR
jgi:predicted Zn-dependent protease